MIEDARDAIKKLFDSEGVQRIVCVDDRSSDSLSVDNFITLYTCLKTTPDIFSEFPTLKNIYEFDNEDVEKDSIRKAWEDIDDEEKKNWISYLLTHSPAENSPVDKDIVPIYVLPEILKGFDLIELSSESWRDRSQTLLEEAKIKRTIFLFDQDLSGEGGSETGGIEFIKNIFESGYKTEFICILLSHTFYPDGEFSRWVELTREYGINPTSIFLISKQLLTEDLLAFVHRIKLTLLNRYCRQLVEMAVTVFRDALAVAKEKTHEINIYDFEHIVFYLSSHEGIWEPETLFRILEIHHRSAMLQKAKTNADIVQLVNQVRSLNSIPIEVRQTPKTTSWTIQRLESYREIEDLQSFHMPLELGDIFEKTSNNKKFILLAQPCELMVRADGTRKMMEAIVAEIVDGVSSNGKDDLISLPHNYELEYFDSKDGRSFFVDFRRTCTVLLWIMDLCVFQDNGMAMFRLEDNCPDGLIPSWRKHYNKIYDNVKSALGIYDELSKKNVRKDILSKIAIPKADNNKFLPIGEINLKEKSLLYKFRRIGRLSLPKSSAMLTKFANYMARSAFDVDFGRERGNTLAGSIENNAHSNNG